MKKLLSISLASLLLVSTIGVTVHKHYCESILVATSILPHGDEDACDTDMPMGPDSCSDEHRHYGIDSPLTLLVVNFELSPSFEWVEATEVLLVSLYDKDVDNSKFYADSLPPPSEPNIYTRDQSFLL